MTSSLSSVFCGKLELNFFFSFFPVKNDFKLCDTSNHGVSLMQL